MAEESMAMASLLGLRPRLVADMTPGELIDLMQGARLRWNKRPRLAAWFLMWLPRMVEIGVYGGIVRAFAKKPKAPKEVKYSEVMDSAPDYDRVLERRFARAFAKR